MWRLIALTAFGCGRLGFDAADLSSDATSSSDAAACGPQSGLIGYWPMNAGDVSTTTVFDRSGNNLHGTLRGTPTATVSPGRIGGALDFAGTTIAYVELPTIPFNNSPSGFNTVSMWFRNDRANVDEGLISLPATPDPTPPRYDLWFTVDVAGPTSLCINAGDGDCWGHRDAQMIGRWVHVVAVFANGQINQGTMYVDGVAIAMACHFSGSCPALRDALNPVTLSSYDSIYPWHGLMDEVRIFNRRLSPAEAQELYACMP